jgi:hypothetical protein
MFGGYLIAPRGGSLSEFPFPDTFHAEATNEASEGVSCCQPSASV